MNVAICGEYFMMFSSETVGPSFPIFIIPNAAESTIYFHRNLIAFLNPMSSTMKVYAVVWSIVETILNPSDLYTVAFLEKPINILIKSEDFSGTVIASMMSFIWETIVLPSFADPLLSEYPYCNAPITLSFELGFISVLISERISVNAMYFSCLSICPTNMFIALRLRGVLPPTLRFVNLLEGDFTSPTTFASFANTFSASNP